MDRHQFVEKLISKRDKLKEEWQLASEELAVARSRSLTHFRNVLGVNQARSAEDVMIRVETNTGGVFVGHLISSGPENERVTDDDIIALCIKIGGLREAVAKTRADVHKFQSEDFVAMIAKELDKSTDKET